MAFRIVIDLVPPPESDLVIGRVMADGDPDKPDLGSIPGQDQVLQGKVHRCHVIAWSILFRSLAQQIQGATLRTAAQMAFGLNQFQAQGVSAVQIKEFMEEVLRQRFVALQADVQNYYRGLASLNMTAGGKMGYAFRTLDELYDQHILSRTQGMRWPNAEEIENFRKAGAEGLQIQIFQNAYDEPAFRDDAFKILARAEYVAHWYQIYHGGPEQSLKLAKFLIENGQGEIDRLIQA